MARAGSLAALSRSCFRRWQYKRLFLEPCHRAPWEHKKPSAVWPLNTECLKQTQRGRRGGKKGSRCCQAVTQPLDCSRRVLQTPLQPPDGLMPAAGETQLDTASHGNTQHISRCSRIGRDSPAFQAVKQGREALNESTRGQ